MLNYLEQQIVRTVMALCMVAVQSPAPDVRDDMRDEANVLIHIWVHAASSDANRSDLVTYLQDWCSQLLPRLESLAREVGQSADALLAAQASVLRLRASLYSRPVPAKTEGVKEILEAEVPQKLSAHDLGTNAKRILEFVRERPNVRTKELIGHFVGTLSDRTVKRCLRELVDARVIMRIEQDGAVQYRIDSNSTFAV